MGHFGIELIDGEDIKGKRINTYNIFLVKRNT